MFNLFSYNIANFALYTVHSVFFLSSTFEKNSDTHPYNLTLEQEYELVRSWGLNETHLVRSNFNAVKAAFLQAHEKKELLKKMRQVYGMDDDV